MTQILFFISITALAQSRGTDTQSQPRLPWKELEGEAWQSEPEINDGLFHGTRLASTQLKLPVKTATNGRWIELSETTFDILLGVLKQSYVPEAEVDFSKEPAMDQTLLQATALSSSIASSIQTTIYRFHESSRDQHGVLTFRGKMTLKTDHHTFAEFVRESTKTPGKESEVEGTGENKYSYGFGYTLRMELRPQGQTQVLGVSFEQRHQIKDPGRLARAIVGVGTLFGATSIKEQMMKGIETAFRAEWQRILWSLEAPLLSQPTR